MKKYIIALTMTIVLLTGCGSSAESVEETTEITSSVTEETKAYQQDNEYEMEIVGSWTDGIYSFKFNEDKTFTAVGENKAIYNGTYSLAGKERKNLSLALAVSEEDIRVYSAEFSDDSTELIITGENGKSIKLINTAA